MSSLPLFATNCVAPIENYLSWASKNLAYDLQCHEIMPVVDEYSDIAQYLPTFDIRPPIESGTSSKSTGRSVISIEWQGAANNQWQGYNQSALHQFRIIAATPAGEGQYDECCNIRDWAIATIFYGLESKDCPLSWPSLSYVGIGRVFTRSRVLLVDDDTTYMGAVVIMLKLRRI